ncbi:MAG: DUF1697 domain-containing protein [Actinomycetes bacterium]
MTFTAPQRRLAGIVQRLERGIEEVLGRPEPVIIRRYDWLQDFVADEPFSAYDDKQWELLVAFLPLSAPPLDAARIERTGGTVIVAVTTHELLAARPRQGRAPHVMPLAERASGLRVTSRGWSTLQRLARL